MFENTLGGYLDNLMTIQNLLLVVIISSSLILVWLLLREVRCWYWKIDKVVYLLERIEAGMEFLVNKADLDLDEKSEKEQKQGDVNKRFMKKAIIKNEVEGEEIKKYD